MAHKGHPQCEFTSKAKCDRARQEAMGRCSALTEKMAECTNWGVERVNGKSLCGQHYASTVERNLKAERAADRKAGLDASIDSYFVASGQQAHDCGEVCYFSVAVFGPRLSDLQAEAAPGPQTPA